MDKEVRVNFNNLKKLILELKPELQLCSEIIEVFMTQQQLMVYDADHRKFIGGRGKSKKLWENPNGVRDGEDVIYQHDAGFPKVKIPPAQVATEEIKKRIEETGYYLEDVTQERNEIVWWLIKGDK